MLKTLRSALGEVVCWGLFVIALAVPVASAESPAKPPALTSEQKKDIQLAAKDVELWQLRIQTAAAELEKARAALQKLVVSLQPPGFVMNERLELVPDPANEPAKK